MKLTTRATLIIGTSDQEANIRYACGFSAPDAVVYAQWGQKKYLVVSPLEAGRARKTTSGIQIVTPQEICASVHQRRRISDWALCLLKREGIKRIRVSDDFPIGVYQKLQRSKIDVRVTKDALFPRRAVKTPDELERIRSMQRISVLAMRAAVSIITRSSIDASGFLRVDKKSLTSQAVRKVIENVLIKKADCRMMDTIVAGGRQGADPHERGSGRLKAGEPIIIDIFPQHQGHGYWGDITRTVIKGKAPRQVKAIYRAVRQAHRTALSKVKPGVACATIHKEVFRIFKNAGFKTRLNEEAPEGFIHGTGHGVGLKIHEYPVINDNPARLRKGHVITIEPGLYYPHVGGVRIEDTVVVTGDGWDYLARCPYVFEV